VTVAYSVRSLGQVVFGYGGFEVKTVYVVQEQFHSVD
jgi:hypothetical protein